VTAVLTGVLVGVGVLVGGAEIFVGVGEGPVVGVGDAVAVGVSVGGAGVFVGVGEGPVVGVLVAVAVGPEAKVRTSWGGEAPSRE
jgi:hypothetical protein